MGLHRWLLALFAGLLITCAVAAPARYYKWQGDDRIVCAQTSPGPGWVKMNGSFVKSDCSI
ncbi:hypothetical protein EGJ27_12250 [Pseudomonas sp. v388]|uniref:hypothetical protein n=1 Tax=Pseudomonas sp. v388 TaxID=2479849 RepID=UPI000F7911D9|nr:hypothetical protein [Pseudomonas sp. v388]RRV07444.1 hypothetical protein EGJ27_12250 [Pseudomonas sp. v388]